MLLNRTLVPDGMGVYLDTVTCGAAQGFWTRMRSLLSCSRPTDMSAEKIGTDAKTLRVFLRASDLTTTKPSGRGRATRSPKDVPTLKSNSSPSISPRISSSSVDSVASSDESSRAGGSSRGPATIESNTISKGFGRNHNGNRRFGLNPAPVQRGVRSGELHGLACGGFR